LSQNVQAKFLADGVVEMVDKREEAVESRFDAVL
jgi:hypothetical protein